jgi:urocanate hydratase
MAEAEVAPRLPVPAQLTGLGASGSTRTVERALALLGEVCLEGSLTLSECARRTQLAASTALRLLRTMETSGFVSRTADGTFHPGTRVVQLGALALGRQSLVTQVQPSLQRIVASTGESAYLVIQGPSDTAVYLAIAEGTHAIRHTSWVGRAIDLEDLAVGRALRGEVAADGYVAQRDRLEPDVTAIAAPIRWPGGIVGALNLLGPTYRIDEATLHRYGAIVAAEAATVSAQLGARQPSPKREMP